MDESLQLLRNMLTERRIKIENASVDAIRQLDRSMATSTKGNYSLDHIIANGVPCELISYESTDFAKQVLYLHGGGYVFGSACGRRDFAARLSEAVKASVILVDYRLAPEHPFPAAVNDAVAAYRWLLQHHDPDHVSVGGDSAGAGLALALLVALRDSGAPLPSACVCISPWTDLACTSSSMERNADIDPLVRKHKLLQWAGYYLGEADSRNPLASPLYANLSGLPRIFIQVGTAEVLYDDATRFADQAKAAGVDVTLEIWPEMVHNWQIFASLLPTNLSLIQAQDSIDHIGRFLQQ